MEEVKFISLDNPYLWLPFRQTGAVMRSRKQGVQFRPEEEGDKQGVYITDNEQEIKALRDIASWSIALCPIQEAGKELGNKPTIDEIALQRERERKRKENEDKMKKLEEIRKALE